MPSLPSRLASVLLLTVLVVVPVSSCGAEESEVTTTRFTGFADVEQMTFEGSDDHCYSWTTKTKTDNGRDSPRTMTLGLFRHSTIVRDVLEDQPLWAELMVKPEHYSFIILHLRLTTNVKFTHLTRGQSIRT